MGHWEIELNRVADDLDKRLRGLPRHLWQDAIKDYERERSEVLALQDLVSPLRLVDAKVIASHPLALTDN